MNASQAKKSSAKISYAELDSEVSAIQKIIFNLNETANATITRNNSTFSKYKYIFLMDILNSNNLSKITSSIFNSDIKIASIKNLIQVFLPHLTTDSKQLYKLCFGEILPDSLSPKKQLLWGNKILCVLAEKLSSKENALMTNMSNLLESINEIPEIACLKHLMNIRDASGWEMGNILIQPLKINSKIDTAFSGENICKDSWGNPKSIYRGYKSKSTNREFIAPSSAENLFISGFFKKQISGYEIRKKQVKYAKLVTKRIANAGKTILEAPTGIGKTLGYLAPMASFAEKNPHTYQIIATSTRNLQEQILKNDWPVISKRFPNVKLKVLKGKSNYVCITSFINSFDEYFVYGTEKSKLAWITIASLIYYSQGDMEYLSRDVFSWLPIIGVLIQDISATHHCNSASCIPQICMYGKQISQAKESQIIITNHHKLLLLEEEFLDSVDFLLIDEGDNLPHNARSAFKTRVNSNELSRLFSRICGTDKRKGFLKVLMKSLTKKDSNIKHEFTYKVLLQIQNDLVKSWIDINKSFAACRHPKRLKYSDRLINIIELNQHQPIIRSLNDAHGRIVKCITLMNNWANDSDNTNRDYARRMKAYINLLNDLQDRLLSTISDIGERNSVHELAFDNGNWQISRTPVYLSDQLNNTLYSRIDRILFTSATIFVNNKSSYFMRETGLINEDISKFEIIKMTNELNYNKNVYCIIDTEIPTYNYKQPSEYREGLLAALLDYIIPIRGKTLVLFMSNADMYFAYNNLNEPLIESGILPLIQSGVSGPIIEQFRQVENSVLFGVDRMWSGVDFPGQTLSQVIIAKAPNPGLNNPIIAHRREHEGDFMNTTYSYIGAMKLRQGFGRLVRSSKDRGAVVILDSRYKFKYHNHLENLPVSPNIGQSRKYAIKKISNIIH